MAKFIVDSVEGDVVTLRSQGNNYRNSFQVKGEVPAPGEVVRGAIRAPAWKVDRVDLGGNYVEPLYGRPRRMQGMVLAVDAARNQLTVQVGYEVQVTLPERYQASDFVPGSRVGWDNVEMPVFVVEG